MIKVSTVRGDCQRAIGQAQTLRGDPTLERMLGTEARVN
jgi:hypothetical protein